MATEAACTLRVGKEQYAGRARIDADHIDFVGPTKFRFRLAEIRDPSYSSGALRFEFHGNKIALNVGDRTLRWYEQVTHPKSPAEKLGVRNGDTVRAVNVDDDEIIRSLESKKVRLVSDRQAECDLVLLGVERPADLRQLQSLADSIRPDGAIWVLVPKSLRTVTQGNIVAAARSAGMIEGKVVSVSEANAAYKLTRRIVIRRPSPSKGGDGAAARAPRKRTKT